MSHLTWPHGASGAVSLTYDDALPCHWQVAAPHLEAAGLRGTFNITIARPGFMEHVAEWKALAARGHELGNHTLFHPCRGELLPGRAWLDPAYDLATYTERRLREELHLANWILTQVDGRTRRTYANTCWHTTIGAGDQLQSIEPMLADHFVAARGERIEGGVDLARINMMNLGSPGADGRALEDLQAQIQATAAAGQWIIYTLHGVGAGTHTYFLGADVHRRLTEWLGANRARIWTAPMIEVAEYLLQIEKSPVQ